MELFLILGVYIVGLLLRMRGETFGTFRNKGCNAKL
jgi:hypothetical protein